MKYTPMNPRQDIYKNKDIYITIKKMVSKKKSWVTDTVLLHCMCASNPVLIHVAV